jgi:hypothetical protein
VSHGEDLSTPISPTNWKEISLLCKEDEDETEESSTSSRPSNIPQSCQEQDLIKQSEVNDVARVLNLTKQQAELLGSRLQQRNSLVEGTSISSFRKRNQKLSSFYDMQDSLYVYLCTSELMEDWGLNTKLKSGGYLLIRLKQWFSTF